MPIAGTLIDSIKLKGSKFRGWMVLGGVLYFVGGTLLFYRFDMEPGPYAIVFCFFFFIYWLGYSASWSSWRALMDPICSHPIDKVGLTAAASQEGRHCQGHFLLYCHGDPGCLYHRRDD